MKKLFLCCIFALLLVPAFSQDAEKLTQILKKDTVNYLDFSYLIASAQGMECSPFEAYTYCDRFGTFPFEDTANQILTVKIVSHFFMNNYGLKGGIMWSLFTSPRYAFKELKSAGFWPQGTDPDSTLSGRDLVRAVSRFLVQFPDARLRNPPASEAAADRRNALLADKEGAK